MLLLLAILSLLLLVARVLQGSLLRVAPVLRRCGCVFVLAYALFPLASCYMLLARAWYTLLCTRSQVACSCLSALALALVGTQLLAKNIFLLLLVAPVLRRCGCVFVLARALFPLASFFVCSCYFFFSTLLSAVLAVCLLLIACLLACLVACLLACLLACLGSCLLEFLSILHL